MTMHLELDAKGKTLPVHNTKSKHFLSALHEQQAHTGCTASPADSVATIRPEPSSTAPCLEQRRLSAARRLEPSTTSWTSPLTVNSPLDKCDLLTNSKEGAVGQQEVR